MILVEKKKSDTFRVTVDEGGTSTRHTIGLDDAYHRKLTAGRISKEELIKKSFEFLLQREPKESILSRFDLPSQNGKKLTASAYQSFKMET